MKIEKSGVKIELNGEEQDFLKGLLWIAGECIKDAVRGGANYETIPAAKVNKMGSFCDSLFEEI